MKAFSDFRNSGTQRDKCGEKRGKTGRPVSFRLTQEEQVLSFCAYFVMGSHAAQDGLELVM